MMCLLLHSRASWSHPHPHRAQGQGAGAEPKRVRRPRVGPALPPSLPEHRRPTMPRAPPRIDNPGPRLALPRASCSRAVGQGAVRAGASPQDAPPKPRPGAATTARVASGCGCSIKHGGWPECLGGQRLRFPGPLRTRVRAQVSKCRVGVLPGPLPDPPPTLTPREALQASGTCPLQLRPPPDHSQPPGL